MWMRNERGLHLCPNRKEKLHISTGMYCMYSSYAVYVVQHLMLISQKTLQVRLSSCHFSHIHLFIAVHHLWDLGRKLLNMVSTDTCTCIHQHYFSGVIVDLLFCLCLKEDEASWWRYQFNGHQVSTAAWTHQISAVKTAFTNSSTVTAQMLRPIKETSQLNNCKIVVEGLF